MGRSKTLVRFARYVQRHFPFAALRLVENPIAARLSRPSDSARAVFVLALPRGGSTLTYQVLLHRLDFTYLSNLWNGLYGIPLCAGWFSKQICKNYTSNFTSDQGFVSGACGPAEGLPFWNYWFDCGLTDSQEGTPTSPSAHCDKGRVNYLNRVLEILTRQGSPFLSGYLGHTLMVDRLREWFPGAVFVRVRRNPLSNAMSILRIRQRTPENWFSLLPRECFGWEENSESLHAQVAAQVYWLNRRLDKSSEGMDDTIQTSYEAICSAPEAEVRRIAAFCANRGMSVSEKHPLPEGFECRNIPPDANQDALQLAQELKTLERLYGVLGRRPEGFGGE